MILPCTREHLLEINEDLQQSQIDEAFDSRLLVTDEEWLNSWARSVVVDGKVVACMGIGPLWEGVGQAWALISREGFERHGVAIGRHARRLLAMALDDGYFNRIQATAVETHPRHREWLRSMGFTCETPNGMKCYAPHTHSTSFLYSRHN